LIKLDVIMKNKTALIIGGVVVFIILLAIIGGSGSNNNPAQTTSSNNQSSLCSDIASLKNQATTVNFKELDKAPDSFKGKIVKFTGQVLQIQEADNYGVIRLAVTKESYGWSIGDIVYVEYQNHTDAVKDDVVTVYGQLTGSKTYESQAHFNITVPSMTACAVEKGMGESVTQKQPAVTKPSSPKTTSADQTQTQPTQQPATPTTPALSVSCSVSQTSLTVGQTAIWTAQTSGGTGSYTYTWSGTDGLSGNTQTITKSYLTAGTKNASVSVVSGDRSVNQSCNNSVSVTKPTPAPIDISGTGQQATQKFSLESGLSIFNLSHNGSRNFAIWLMDFNGNNVDLLVNTVGQFNGSKAVGIAGSYLLNVTADGAWTVNITQPRVSTAPATTNFTGSGQQASQLFYLSKGLHVFQLTHDGSSNFAIWLMDKNGNNIDLLVNTVGAFNGSKAVGVDSDGIYLLNISADGNWTVSIQ